MAKDGEPDVVREHWNQARTDLWAGLRSFREHLGSLKMGARHRWGRVRAEMRNGSGALWRELRIRMRRMRHKIRRK